MIKKHLLKLADHTFFFAYLKRVYSYLRNLAYMLVPINNKLIVFESFRSTKFADSPRAIYEFISQQEVYRDYRFIWVFEKTENYEFIKNERTSVVRHESLRYYLAFARSKYWVVNGWIPLRLQKKPGQVALQCWHGTPLKRLRYDIITSAPTEHKKNALLENDEDMLRYDYLISPSKFATEAFTSAFNLKFLNKTDTIIETGYPRNDLLVNASKADYESGRRKYKIPRGKKVLLYAPTWRDDQYNDGGGYKYKESVNFEMLRESLSSEWVILFRAHNIVANSFDFSHYRGFIRDVSDVDDINELYIISDALMTDYSSVFFDYANLHRPILFFMYDLEHYQKDLRGFYLNLNQLPGDVVQTERQIINRLNNLTKYQNKLKKRYKTFNATYNYLDDGGATKRVADILMSR